MLHFLFQRPIAVGMTLLALLAASVVAFFQLPISLLPDMDVPQITIMVRSPNSPPEEVEQNILRPIRESMLTLNSIRSIESIANQESGTISLLLNYGTDIDLSYIEANEKIDRLASFLPSNSERPLVVKNNISDIPIARIQVLPAREEDLPEISKLALLVLKRRLEQIDGIGMVDISGTQEMIIRVAPKYEMLHSLGLTESDITRAIEKANIEIGSLSVRDGNYRYYLKMSSRLTDPETLGTLPIKIPNGSSIIQLKEIASVYSEAERPNGFHIFNDQTGIVINLHKQARARMPEVMPKIYEIVDLFRSDYPTVAFEVTQDQSLLLKLSINNLSQALLWGGVFAFLVLFLFSGGWREPVVMGIVLPVSLVLCFLLFYLFDLSLNIISLSGLALGLGMLVDNSIVVIDNITLKRRQGHLLFESCVEGTGEMVAPLVGSALTNLVVFIPIVFLSGITGALFYDQAMAVTCILFVSMFCTFIFVPLLYLLLNRNRPLSNTEDSRIFNWLKSRYHTSFLWVWNHKIFTLSAFLLLIPTCLVLLLFLPKQGFPNIERIDTVLEIEWNEPIEITASRERLSSFFKDYKASISSAEFDIGLQQFAMGLVQHSAEHSNVYLKFENESKRQEITATFRNYFALKYPTATVNIGNAPNAFEQLFVSDQPLYEIKLRDLKLKQPMPIILADTLLLIIQQDLRKGKGFETQTMAYLQLDFVRMKLYQIDFDAMMNRLKTSFGDYHIADVQTLGDAIPIKFKGLTGDFELAIRNVEVVSTNGHRYPIREFIKLSYDRSYKSITADGSGIYQSLLLDSVKLEATLRKHWIDLAKETGLTVDFGGTWFETQKNMKKLIVILLVSLVLMYFIITAEFESFNLPLIVMSSIPIGFSGSLLLLWMTGGTINIMSGIGLVVVLGILDNDAILKIDRIHTLSKTLPLEQAIQQAGLDRLKPIVMNTCTNILALTPILFTSGLGSDLQRPVAITTIGGLIVATLAAMYFVPLMYWILKRKN